MPGKRRLRDLVSAELTQDPASAFWRAANQRRDTAAYLLNSGFSDKYLDAVYLAGYAAECALKSLILRRTPKTRRPGVLAELTTGARAHDFTVLSRLLTTKGCSPPREIREHLVSIGREWRTDLRYVGSSIRLSEGEEFLRRVDAVCNWVQRSE